MTEEIKKVPAGVLAEAALRDQEAASETKPEEGLPVTAASTPSPAIVPVDPNYREPTPLKKYIAMHDSISRDAHAATTGEEVLKASMGRKVLIDFLLGRIAVLEEAIKPFCVTGSMFANAQMCLAAEGDTDSPPGGTWISNPPEGIRLQPSAGYFFNAVDVFGRAATEAHMTAIFERVQAANKLHKEKLAHVEAGGTVH